MEKGTDKEHCQWRHISIIAQVNDWNVHVSHAPTMHRHIPRAPKCVNIIWIPPIAVETTVGKVQQLADQIEYGMELYVEKAQPYEVIRYLWSENND